ncbi:hypothetical protein LLF88_06640 [bacterium]|nr:hypothetical protein [bacterium]
MGSSSHTSLLTSLGYDPQVATRSDLGVTVTLNDIKNVYVASDQPQSFYNGYATHAAELTAWVEEGEHLVFSACDQGWESGNLTTPLPGGATKVSGPDSQGVVAGALHPIATGELSDGVPMTSPFIGNWASHTYLSNLPSGSDVILTGHEDYPGCPTLVEYRLGLGLVLCSCLTWEIAYDLNWTFATEVYDDLFLYAFPKTKYVISAVAGLGGTISPSGDITVYGGSSKTFTITANAGNMISSILVDGAYVPVTSRPAMTYTFSNISANHTISASFTRPDTLAPVIELPDGVPQSAVGSPYDLHLIVADDTSIADVGIFENEQRVGGSYTGGDIRVRLTLPDGRHDLVSVAVDGVGNRTERAITLVVDTRSPVLTIDPPSSVSKATFTPMGSAVDAVSGLASLTINGEPVVPFLDGSFSATLALVKGANVFVIEAADRAGNTTSETFTVTYASASSSPSSLTVVLTIGSADMQVNGMTHKMDATPFAKDGRTLLPIRALIEAIGGSVQWNASTKTTTVMLGQPDRRLDHRQQDSSRERQGHHS